MQTIPYLNFDGNCREAFEVYEKVLGGKIVGLHTYGEAPPEAQMSPELGDKVMHVRLEAAGAVLMGSDAPPPYFEKAQGLFVSLMVDDPGEAERIFGELSQGGRVTMPIEETFWAKRFGMFTDRFGTPWMINCG